MSRDTTDSSTPGRAPARRSLRGVVLPGVALVVAAGIGTASIVSGISARDETEKAAGTTLPVCAAPDRASLVPASGALFGVNLDLAKKSPARFAADLGHKPAVSGSFIRFPYTVQEKTGLSDVADQLRANGQIMMLTLEPVDGLETVTDEAAAALADDLAAFNADGVPVIVRFAHEMNGSWYPWAQQPMAFREAFTKVADALHAKAPGSAMMWAPNYAGNYPFAGGQFEATPGTPEFEALDTDHDGALTMADDPYAPYYPGDAAVDWAGITLYHWGATYPWGENEPPEPNKFTDQLSGTYSGTDGDQSRLPDFYAVYGTERGKPVAIADTAAMYAPDAGGATEMDIKKAWWEQLFSPAVATEYPQLKMINWFEWDKAEVEVGGRVDWTVTNTPAVREAFTAALPGWLSYGPAGACRPAD